MRTGGRVVQALDSVLGYARLPLSLEAYGAHASAHDHRVVHEVQHRFALVFCDGFAVMLEEKAPLARIPVVGLFDDDDDDEGSESYPWVEATTECGRLDDVFDALRGGLMSRVGKPAVETRGSGEGSFCAWSLAASALVLLWNDEGDAHIGERSTVDLRIAPHERLAELPHSVATVFGWPVEY